MKTNIIIFIVSLFVGATAGWMLHPYEQCERKYDAPEDVSECVWIKKSSN